MALFSEPVVVVAGQKHPLAHAGELTWADVVSYPWILPQPNSVARQAIDALFALNALTPPTNTIASLSQALNLELLRVMPAIGLLPQRLAQEQAALGRTVILPLETQDLLSEARCFWRKDQASQNPTLSLFLKCLQESTEDTKTIPFD
jgi:DNA-binding transcriptional LysR family regulator